LAIRVSDVPPTDVDERITLVCTSRFWPTGVEGGVTMIPDWPTIAPIEAPADGVVYPDAEAEIVVVPAPVGWKVTTADESPLFRVTGEPTTVPTLPLLLLTLTEAETPGARGSASRGLPDPSSDTG
jgi:hypothetical protein